MLLPDMNTNGGHPDEGLLHEWLDEQLSATDAAEMHSHVASCAECRARVAEAHGLIAASHRILSALDDVPAGVIPANIPVGKSVDAPSAAEGVEGAGEKLGASGVVSMDEARKSRPVVPARNAFNWKRAGSIAALLLVAVTTVQFFAKGGSVVTPSMSVATEMRKAAPAAPAAEPERALASGNVVQKKSDAGSIADSQDVTASDKAARAKLEKAGKPLQGVTVTEPDGRPRPAEDFGMDRTAKMRTERPAPGNEMARRAFAEAQSRLQPPAVANAAAAKSAADSQVTVAAASPVPVAGAALAAVVSAAAPPPTAVADQTALRVDSTGRAAAGGAMGGGGAAGGRGGGRGGGGGGGRGGGGRAGPPVQTATGSAATTGTVTNAPPGTAATIPPLASPPVTSPLAANAAVADTSLRGRVAGATVSSASSRLVDSSSSSRTVIQLREGFGAGFGGRGGVPGTAFDSVTLMRTECTPGCLTTSLNINAAGVVRYLVGTGNTQRVAMGQLTTAEQSGMRAVLDRAFPEATVRVGNTACVIAAGRPSGAPPQVYLLLSYPGVSTQRPEPRCTKTIGEIRQLGVSIDSIARIETLKRGLSPKE